MSDDVMTTADPALESATGEHPVDEARTADRAETVVAVLDRPEAQAVPEAASFAGPLSPMARWVADASDIYRMAVKLAATSFVPDAYRNKPYEVTAAMLTGLELGMQPMASIRAIVPIQGTPTLKAESMRALLQAAGHRIQVVEASPKRVVVHGWRQGEFDVPPHVSVWTIERAAQLRLTGKSNWQNMPQNMLVARGTSECCRLTAADALGGIHYSTEEMEDVAFAEKPKRKSRAKASAPTVPRLALAPPGAGVTGPGEPDPGTPPDPE
ncbi:hypothetical protein LO763_22260 [Glycomyces sp. A-F 0318]|uniref:hypothetical protein n=1 Tax=Glycomyces amatae TaxID=2881355 RepID=UPI001E4A00C8|nr:hypothetical protein [Glycomyces amatae]MCD0446342.1 hypothetical protein [Glycomyces amatae]